MIRFYRKIFFFNLREIWFNYQFSVADIFGINVFRDVKNVDRNIIPGVKEISHTIQINLEQDLEAIASHFSEDVRRKVRKAEKEGVTCYFHNETDKFVAFINDFAAKKKTFTTSKRKMIELGEYINMSFAEYDGRILAAQSFLIDKDMKIVTGLHSGTTRLQEGADKSMVGRAHKMLIVKNIAYFKERGFKVFDFGGYALNTKDESMKGINNFKLSFGGKVVPCINYYSYSYWILRKLASLFRLSGKL